LHGLKVDRIDDKAKKLLELFDLKQNIHDRMNTFSKGMKQKVLIISGIIHNPDVIFMDEPLDGLDDNLGIRGLKGVLFDTRAIGADWRYVFENMKNSILTISRY